MRSTFIKVAVIGIIALGCKRKPCEDCPDIAGSYTESTKDNFILCDQWSLEWGGTENATISVTQEGSAITMSSRDGTMKGTLYDNGSINFGTAHIPLYDGSGSVASSADLSLYGSFKNGGFSGSYTMAESSASDCALNIPATWKKK